MKRRLMWWFGLSVCLTLGLTTYSLLAGEDRFSNMFRITLENRVNQTLARLSQATAKDTLTPSDRRLVKVFVSSGIALGRWVYPEAAQVLSHYINGKGKPLALPSDYFQKSRYLNELIHSKKDGIHGPLTFQQKRDWRLSLALNPLYLAISGDHIKLYHPKIEFAHAPQSDVYTVVPIGKLNIVFYDNLISALNPTPFYVFSEWTVASK
ncbi:hypothetical protein sS8_5076 [Methylocaldum marinum]|uniref:Uncharacterized protein n=1 Tax=Methylocaldum marinum TaxID=1432792 RepID=A0A250L2Y6_9GAMM|nr:hypothetical protein [Methylocaldum marinum]BBA36999.1 hypothetical protein sS8_5076 [Methylocaldum marinum]